jgi:hypothetical protein
MKTRTPTKRKPREPRRPLPMELKLDHFGKCDCKCFDCVNSLLRSHDVSTYTIGRGRNHGHMSIWQSQN